MNKVLNVNLGGYPFIIDLDAYDHLSQYLQTIKKHFRSSEGYEEITSDIEARLAELFQERLEHRKIITLRDVKGTIAIMGTPEDFGAEPIEEDSFNQFHNEEKAESNKTTYKTGKRLFRNPDDQTVGGVASGIAAYFGVEDPLWIRLLFVIVTISGGFGIPLYIILWVIVPEAETAGDRLAMRGEPINVSNISKIIEEEALKFSEKATEWSNDLNEKMSGKKKDTFDGEEVKQFLSKAVFFIGKFITGFVDIIKTIGRPLLIFIALIILVLFAVSWIGSVIGLFMAEPFVNYLTPDAPYLAYLGGINFMMLLGIPMLAILLFILRMLFSTHVSGGWKIAIWSIWTANLFCLLSIVGVTASNFTAGSSVDKKLDLPLNLEHLTLNVEEDNSEFLTVHLGNLQVSDKKLIHNGVCISIEKSDTDQFEVIEERFAMGSNLEQANQLAQQIDYGMNYQEGQLNFKPNFVITQGNKWRAQEVSLIIKVPEGKTISFSNRETLANVRHYTLEDNHWSIWRAADKNWMMKSKGLSCVDCSKEKEEEGYYGYENFNQLQLNGLMRVMIEQGEKFNVRVDSREKYRKTIKITEQEGILNISTHLKETSSPIRLYITMPSLVSLEATDTDDIRLSGFVEPKLNILNVGTNDIKAIVEVDSINIKQVGKNEVDLRGGKGTYLNVNLDRKATLDARGYEIKLADMVVNGKSKAYVSVSDTLKQQVGEESTIRPEGKPLVMKNF